MRKRLHAWRKAVSHRLIVVLLVTTFGATVSAPAGAEPATSVVPGGFASWEALYAEQIKINAGADRIVSAGKALSDNGYAGIIAAPENRAIVLYWRGTVPASVQAVIAEVAKSTPVQVRPARYSLAEMDMAAKRILYAGDSKTTTVAEVSANVDGSGVTVKAVGGRLDSAAASLVANTPVAVRVESAGGYPSNTSRFDDSAPYYGGARWGIANNTPFCTTGWPVWRNGRTMMLTAAHCTGSGVHAYDGGNDYMGPTRDRWMHYDSMLIDVSSGPYMLDGDIYSNWSKPIVGVTLVYEGSWLCTSGAKSGVICSMRVTEANVGYTAHGVGVYPAYRANKVGSGPVSGQGDSGGPVFSLATDPSRVLAVGIITAGQWGTETWCQGEGGRTCYSGTYFVHVYTSGDAIGFSIRTL